MLVTASHALPPLTIIRQIIISLSTSITIYNDHTCFHVVQGAEKRWKQYDVNRRARFW